MRTAGGNMNHVTPAYKVGDVVEVVEENAYCTSYAKGQLVMIEEINFGALEVRGAGDNHSMTLEQHHIKHRSTEERYKLGDIVEIAEDNPIGSGYTKGQLVTLEQVHGNDIAVRAGPDSDLMLLYLEDIKHPATEGYPEQARVEQGYWTGQMSTDEIDSPRSLNDATPAAEERYRVGDVVEVVEEDPSESRYFKGQHVVITAVSPSGFYISVEGLDKGSTTKYLSSEHIKHTPTEGFPTQGRSLNDATPDEWDQASKIAMDLTTYGTGAMFVGGDSINHIPAASLFEVRDEPDGFDIADLDVQVADPLDTQVGGSHYRDMEIQPIEFITANKLGWCEGHVVKYVSRHANKGGKQDLEKAKHYIDMLIAEVYDA